MTTAPELDLLARELAQPEGTVRNPRRNGKIARLPAATRDILNHMLDDGLPYKVILDELGPHGQGLNTQNITNWVHGGYQDYLARQDALDRARAQIEIGLELVKEFDDIDIATVRRACNYVTAVQLLEALRAHGDETLKKLFQNRPAKYLNAINTLCRQSNASVKVERLGLKPLLSGLHLAPSSPIKPNQGVAGNPENCNHPTPASQPYPPGLPSSQIKPNQGVARNPENCNHLPPASQPYPPELPSSPIKPNQGAAGNPDTCNLPPPDSQPHPRELPSSQIKASPGILITAIRPE